MDSWTERFASFFRTLVASNGPFLEILKKPLSKNPARKQIERPWERPLRVSQPRKLLKDPDAGLSSDSKVGETGGLGLKGFRVLVFSGV